MTNILVTGVTGAIGLPLLRQLLQSGHRVGALIRAKSVDKLAQSLSIAEMGALDVLHGDVTLQGCGVDWPVLAQYHGKFDIVIHAAGNVQYYEHKRPETYAVNEGGTKNVIDLANSLGIRRFAYVSTAYVAGKRAYLSEFEKGNVEDSYNPYESSKIVAEEIVRAFQGSSIILRLGTVIGHVDTGRIENAGGYAGFVKGFWARRSRLLKYPRNPFLAAVNPSSTLNLVTNEWVVEMIEKAACSDLIGSVHLAHPDPVSMATLFEHTFHRGFELPVIYDRLRFLKTTEWQDPLWRKEQEFVTGVVEYFGPYVTRDTVFGHERVKEVPGYRPPPPVTERVLRAQIEYMIDYLFPNKSPSPVPVAAE